MENRHWTARVDWRHIIVVVGIAAVISLYLFDAINASTKVGNLILVLPASILGLLLCLLTIASIINDARKPIAPPPEEATADAEVQPSRLDRCRPFLMLMLFAIYILLIPLAGMDGASALFLAAALYLNGERRIWFILGYALVFAAAATWLFKSILPYPLYTLFI
ncbi:tripartite tricarboxylate transporter TctB family protein [Bordetella sp. 02P26C-1]|uniref:tripartite tricarboxylate transporter TctB family protein n=1 Tax=Bordetella sp. 02P26C-1 TaxID=2683195 RepID=UPI001355F080|nr:tripartite tricarboxylate transporter TctB family protein [Bordetella sp. 02P26C-1]MVW77688.1 hypothetical protein [Bordetella sp. 02P26C-1]